MRYVRYLPRGEPEGDPSNGAAEAAWGRLKDGVVHALAGAPFDGDRPTGVTHPAESVRLLAPSAPSKVLAVGRNFRSHLHGREAPTEPGLFVKLPTSVIGPGDPIVLPGDSSEVHFEGELVVVMGRTAKNVSMDDAPAHIFGVTAGNDVSERTWQKNDLQWFRAKGSDSFGPLGPVIATDLDHDDLLIESRLNGETTQSERSRDLIFPIAEVVSYASRYVTLVPGDVIYTGTPGSTSALTPGDRVEVEVEGVGTLANPVVAAG
ncbi:MAG: fumarylacetoacetate hydrolase family protein [Gemmatimonadetes bacterium]|nr:fumarylacetoacetate hydrolase family protein [Gemmatimonadota bacterium]